MLVYLAIQGGGYYMSYAIIRNQKYKRENLKGIFRHNERKNENYSNKNIDKEKSYLNYSLKDPKYSYEKDFERIRKEYNLKGQIKTVSNIACEYIITSDNEFFNKIGEKETRRFFETAYKFVCEYKNLGEQYILSAKVHNDEDTPHMHLVFLPVVHTKDKKGNDIDKLACSEFWKEKDSYRRLQNAFYEYIILHNFELERGLPKEETNRTHLSIEEYKKITNYEKTKEILQDITLELPEVPSIEDFNKVVFKRNEKIQKEIIEPKDKLIEKLYSENKQLHREIERQVNVIDEAEKYQKERDKIIAENKELNSRVKKIENEYKEKSDTLDLKFDSRKRELEKEFEEKNYEMKYEYKSKIRNLEKENNKLHKIIDKFYETIEKFITWICKKFDIGAEDYLIRDFQKETNTFIDPVKQIKHEEREKEWDLER